MRCAGTALHGRFAAVRATFKIRSYARAESCKPSLAVFKSVSL